MATVNNFKIGADPEYYVINKEGNHVNIKAWTTKEAEVGWDHEGDVLEVKPRPSKYAYRVVRRIRKLLLQHEVSKKLIASGYRFRSCGYLKTPRRSLGVGGHIHFDIPYSQYPQKMKELLALKNITILLEKLDILPNRDSIYRHTYQVLEEIRNANDADRIEYRYMCSWLHSPVAALICLTAGKLAVAYPETVLSSSVESNISMNALAAWFEQFKGKDVDAARVVEKIFEPKLKLEAQLDVDLEDAWKSLKKIGGSEGHELGAAL